MITRYETAARDDALVRVRAAATRHVNSRTDLADALDELAAAHDQAASAFHALDRELADRHADAATRCSEEAADHRRRLAES